MPCSLFAYNHSKHIGTTKRLLYGPFNHWNGAAGYFKNHDSSPLHKATIGDYLTLQDYISGKTMPIETVLDEKVKAEVSKNRRLLYPICDTILTCGRQVLALRGHEDQSKRHPEPGGFATKQVDNFIELLHFKARDNPELIQDMKECAKNKTYVSPPIQNELIQCFKDVLTEEILKEVRANKFYSILGDECTDSAQMEQFALVLRFVDSKNQIREEFIRFIHCSEGLSGAALKTVSLEVPV